MDGPKRSLRFRDMSILSRVQRREASSNPPQQDSLKLTPFKAHDFFSTVDSNVINFIEFEIVD